MATTKTNGRAKNRIADKVSTPAKTATKVRIEPIQIATVKIPIIGTSELIVHRFDEKTQGQIADKQAGAAKQKKGNRNPKDEYQRAFYMLRGKPGTKSAKYGIPAAGFKNAAVSAARFVDGLKMTELRGSFFVRGDGKDTNTGVELVELTTPGPKMRTDTVRLSGPGNPADLRYRPGFEEWSCVLTVQYNSAMINAEQLVNLFNNAGFGVGVCEWRPEKNGDKGQFQVDVSKLEKV